MFSGMFSFGKTENCSADQIKLITPGNLRWLYIDQAKMRFATPEEEVHFWAQEGLSKTVYVSKGRYPQLEYPLETARMMVAAGQGDIIVRSKEYKNVTITGRQGDYKVRLLHECFKQYRERVRQLSESLAVPIGEVERTAEDSMRSFTKSLMG